jgi:hypothetical protein
MHEGLPPCKIRWCAGTSAQVPRCGTHSSCGLAAFWACSPARFCEMTSSNQLPGSPHENLACALIPCTRRGSGIQSTDKSCNKTGVSSRAGAAPRHKGRSDQRTTSQIPCIIDVRAPDARVERPVSCAQRRSKTSVTTNRSATAVNSAISVIVRSLIDLAVARWEPEGTGHRSDIAG